MRQVPPPKPGRETSAAVPAAVTPQQIAAALPQCEAPGIAEDLTCLACGYRLRGLHPRGRCPECGVAITQSLRGDRLAASDPDYTSTLSRGALVLIIGLFAAAASGIGIIFARASGSPLYVRALIGLIAESFVLAGAWRVTTADPGRVRETRLLNLRRFIRLALVLGVAHYLLYFAAWVLDQAAISLQEYVLLLAAGALLMLCQLAGRFALFVHMRRLALRLPDPKLASATTIVKWGLILARFTAMLLPMAVSSILSVASVGLPALLTMSRVVDLVIFVATISSLVFGFWWLLLLLTYRRKFAKQAPLARRHRSVTPATRPVVGGSSDEGGAR